MKFRQEHSDAIFYEIAVDEIQSGKMNRGLMAKAVTKSNGDKKRAEILYLEWRVSILLEEAVEKHKRKEEESKNKESEAKKKEAEAKRIQREKKARLQDTVGGTLEWWILGTVVIVVIFLALSKQ